MHLRLIRIAMDSSSSGDAASGKPLELPVSGSRSGSLEDRLRGALLGLAAGDTIGGPLQMALTLAESLKNDLVSMLATTADGC